MKLTKEQKQEIADQQTQKNYTKRVTSLELEKILYEALPVLDYGCVRVVDYMGDDSSIVQSARVSYGKGTKKVSTDEGLIKYLMKNKNTIGPSIHNVEPFFISEFYQNSNKSILYIGKDEREISSMEQKIKWLLPDVEILLFKSWDQIPYDNVSPSKEVQIERLKTLKILSNSNAKRIILTTINSITQKIIPKSIIN